MWCITQITHIEITKNMGNYIANVTFWRLIRYIYNKTENKMRRLSTLLVALLLGISAISAQKFEISGTVIDTSDSPIPYATVILTEEQQSKQITGGTTNAEGYFAIYAEGGDYEINISYIGYNLHKKNISLSDSINLGNITLEESSQNIDQVVVTSQLIRREADRFVIDVANSPIALGKDGEEGFINVLAEMYSETVSTLVGNDPVDEGNAATWTVTKG